MANIIITNTASHIKAEFNELAEDVVTCYKSRSSILSVTLHTGRKGTYVEVVFYVGDKWTFDTTAARGKVVDTIAGIAPTDNADLTDKLAALML